MLILYSFTRSLEFESQSYVLNRPVISLRTLTLQGKNSSLKEIEMSLKCSILCPVEECAGRYSR